MLIKTNFVPSRFDAITCWPFILIRSTADQGLIEHELVHYHEQQASWVIPWLLRYWLSKKFRLAAEVRGYHRQIEVGGISLESAAHYLLKYGFDLSYNQAIDLLRSGEESPH